MNKSIVMFGILGSIFSATCLGWGLPASLPGTGGAQASGGGADVDKFLADGKASTAMINNSRDLLVKSISTKEERDAHQAKMDQIKKGLDAKDKKSSDDLKKLNEDDDSKLLAATSDKAAQDKLKNLNAEQKKAVMGAFTNLGLGILLQTQQIKTGQNLVSSAAGNMSLASKLPELKDAVADMGSNVKTGGELLSKLPALFKSANINVEVPKDTSTKPVDVKDPF